MKSRQVAGVFAAACAFLAGLACEKGHVGTDEERAVRAIGRPSPTVTGESGHSRAPRRKAGSDRRSRYEQFIPPTYRRGRVVVLPVAFPDGSTADLTYPPKLELSKLGLQPYIAAGIQTRKDRYCCNRFVAMTKTDPGEFREGTKPTAVYEGPAGPVEVWPSKNNPDVPEHMFFRFGSWNVIIGDGNVGIHMKEKHRRIWAHGLIGRETERGFIILEPRRPMVLSPPGDGGGPGLLLSERFVFMDVRLGRCDEPERSKGSSIEMVDGVSVERYKTGRQFGANWCTADRQLSFYIDARDNAFVDLAVRGLRVENLDVNEDAHLVGR